MSPEAPDRPPLDADAVAQHTFSKGRKGYETDAVRAYLVGLASEIRDLQRINDDLARRLVEVERRAADPKDLDEESVTQLLGEETARVLVDARKAAAEIRSKAEAEATETVEAAREEAAATRSAVEEYAADVRATADREVSEQRATAQAEVDEMTTRARDVLAERTAEAEAAAAEVRAAGDVYDERTRAEADEYALATRTDADAYREEVTAAADSIRADSEADASRTRAEAESAAAETRSQADRDRAERLAEASAEEERIVADAKEKGRTMVQEARDYREKVIADLADRRRSARDELERVVKSRDALAVSLTDVRTQVERSHRALQDLDIDPRSVADGGADRRFLEVDESASSVAVGELDVAVPADLGEFESEPVVDPVSDEEAVEAEAETEPEAEAEAEVVTEAEAEVEPVAEDVAEAEPAAVAEEAAEVGAAAEAGAADEADVAEVLDASVDVEDDLDDEQPVWSDDEPVDEPVTVEGDASPSADEEDVEDVEASGAGEAPAIDDLFARIRAESGAPPAESESESEEEPDEEPEPTDGEGTADDVVAEEAEAGSDEELLDRRDAATDEIERQLSRRLKRLLSDEQNEALHDLRGVKGTPTAAEVFPSEDEHRIRYRMAILEDLQAAERAGAGFYGDAPARAADVSDIAEELSDDLVRQVRLRVERAFDNSDDPDDIADEIRTLYREWKTQRIAEAARHFVMTAFARGVAEAAPDGTSFRWVVDHGGAAAPDCEDNALAGAVPKGEAFPTGDLCPPTHPGCRCLAVPAS